MADNYSNHLKVVLVMEDICEMSDAILRSNCFTVQHFHYESRRSRNDESGVIRYAEDSTVLDITIRINNPDGGKQLFAHMQDQELHTYSFLFNATFKPTGRIDRYEDAMMTFGYVVDIEEDFSSNQPSGRQEQMLMHVKLLLSSIVFMGRDRNLEFKI